MKKQFIVLSVLSLFMCGCANSGSESISDNDYQSALNEINSLKDQIEALENRIEAVENNNLAEDDYVVITESDEDIPEEYKAALENAISYEDIGLYLSKLGLYEKLISEPLNFSEDAAQYAIDHYDVDYFFNALEYAKQYNFLHNSRDAFYDRLISIAKFTEEEAQYAIDNAGIDWKANALNQAKSYQDILSIDEIREYLAKAGFTEEEIDYAVENLDIKQGE